MNFLYNEDCLKVLRAWEGSLVDVVVTSPPYNLGINYGNTVKDNLSRTDYALWMLEVFGETKRVLKDDGHVFLNLGSNLADPMAPFSTILQLQIQGWCVQNVIHWVKSIAMENEVGDIKQRGHYKPINSPRFLNDCHEYIFHLTKSGSVPINRTAHGVGVKYTDPSNEARWEKGTVGLHCRGNCWYIPYETIKSRKKDRGTHPATFPEKLVELCCRLGWKEHKINTLLDPFMGTGTSGVVAKKLGWDFIGIELNPDYFRYAKERIKG